MARSACRLILCCGAAAALLAPSWRHAHAKETAKECKERKKQAAARDAEIQALLESFDKEFRQVPPEALQTDNRGRVSIDSNALAQHHRKILKTLEGTAHAAVLEKLKRFLPDPCHRDRQRQQ